MIKVNIYSDGSVFIEANGRNSDTGQSVIIAKSYPCIESAALYIEGYRELLGQNVAYIYQVDNSKELNEWLTDHLIAWDK